MMNTFKRRICKMLGCDCIHTPDLSPAPKLGDFEPHQKQPVNIYKTTAKRGVDLIKKWEGFESKVYWDKHGKVWTIGYGSTGKGINKDTPPITRAQGHKLLMNHVRMVEEAVNSLVKVPISQNQFDALVCFAYNVGTDIDDDTKPEGLGDSTLLKLLNERNYDGAANEFPKWIWAGGVKLNGLRNRRLEEQALFNDLPETVEV